MTYFSSKVGVNIPYCTDFNANQRSKFTYFQHIYKSRTAITGFTACSIASSYRYQQLLVRMIKYIMYTHGSPSICTYLHRFRTSYMSANSNKFAFRNHSAIVEQLSSSVRCLEALKAIPWVLQAISTHLPHISAFPVGIAEHTHLLRLLLLGSRWDEP